MQGEQDFFRVEQFDLDNLRRDAEHALKDYERALDESGRVPYAQLGVGYHAHEGYYELAESLSARLKNENGTCESFWQGWLKRESAAGCKLMPKARKACKHVTVYMEVKASQALPTAREYDWVAPFVESYRDRQGAGTNTVQDHHNFQQSSALGSGFQNLGCSERPAIGISTTRTASNPPHLSRTSDVVWWPHEIMR